MYINGINKENIDLYLKELAKDYKKRTKGYKQEIIIVGGASVILNYDFRDMSYDIDAIFEEKSILKESINKIGDEYKLPNGWLNDEFIFSNSYTPKIITYSKYYKTYSNVLEVRTITDEYLIAMKLVSFRKYKRDLSDIIGILFESEKNGNKITYSMIDKAINDLYGDWTKVTDEAKSLITNLLKEENLEMLYNEVINSENEAKETLLQSKDEIKNEKDAQDLLNKKH